MGNGKASSRRGWAWVTGLTLVAALLTMAPAASEAVEVGTGESIMVFIAHPDDDIITAAGIIEKANDAGNEVNIVYMTNGDRCDSPSQYYPPDPGPDGELGTDDDIPGSYCWQNNITSGPPLPSTVRQGEAVAGQAVLGVSESNLIFLGYPNGFLADIRAYNAPTDTELVHTETYASRGLGSTDWHNHHFGGHGQYNRADMLTDVQSLIDTYRPDHIFTHSPWDRHNDHYTTYLEIVEAISNIQVSDPSYQPLIHTTIVHVADQAYWGLWPASANPTSPINEYFSLGSDTSDELVWDQRESFDVSDRNRKSQAIEAHVSQAGADQDFIRRFVHSDEIFWVERVGVPEGMPDSYTVDEGGSLSISASGVLANDVRGVTAPASQSINPSPLGPMSAQLVSGPSHAATFLLGSDGSFSYVNDGSETASDSFTYLVKQGSTQASATTTVTININPVNDNNPVAVADGYTLDNGDTLVVPVDGVLGNDSDVDGDNLTAVKVSNPAHGSLSFNSDGSFTYTHDGSAMTSDSFTYKANDGAYDSNIATVSLTINSDVIPVVDPLVVTVNGPVTGATGTTYSFSATVAGGEGPRSYSWDAKHEGTTVPPPGNGSTFSFSSSIGGDYTIELTVTDDSGSASGSIDVKLLGDISGLAFTDDIVWLADAGITQGCNPPTNDLYCPNDRVTRGQMAAFLVRFLGLTDINSSIQFTDIAGSVFETNVLKMATAGITRGCNPPANDRFCPTDYVTRGQMAAFLVRALGLTDQDPAIDFIDDDGLVFEDNIEMLATAGITRGCNPPANDRFCPNDYVTRGQMAAFLHRADGLGG